MLLYQRVPYRVIPCNPISCRSFQHISRCDRLSRFRAPSMNHSLATGVWEGDCTRTLQNDKGHNPDPLGKNHGSLADLWIYLCTHDLSIYLSVYLSVYLSICLSFYLPIYLVHLGESFTGLRTEFPVPRPASRPQSWIVFVWKTWLRMEYWCRC